MKKLIILLSFLIVFVSGCSIKSLNSSKIDNNVDTILSSKNKLYNVYFDGYKYYVPKGLKFIRKNDYNAIIRDKNNNKYYLYVDAVSYYHKSENTYELDGEAYYSKKLNYGKNNGYLEINKKDDKYFVEYVFNYSKIEVYTNEKNLNTVINNSSYILRSIKFNDKILASIIDNEDFKQKEETFNIFESKSSSDDFLNYVEEYDSGKDKKMDEDTVDVDFE